MERKNNIYGEIINSKFSHLLSANMNETWTDMKQMLDTELPEKKRKKWLAWFGSRTGIIAVILISLIASATSVYLIKTKKPSKTDQTSKEKKLQKPATSNRQLSSKENADNPKIAIYTPIKDKKQVLVTTSVSHETANKVTLLSSEVNKGKIGKLSSIINEAQTENKQTRNEKIITVKDLQLKDSIVIPPSATEQEVVQKRKAF